MTIKTIKSKNEHVHKKIKVRIKFKRQSKKNTDPMLNLCLI
jgi:hypothetical protein